MLNLRLVTRHEAEKLKSTFQISDAELSKKYPDLRTETQALQKDLGTARGKLAPPPRVHVLADNLEPSQSYLLLRGYPVRSGDPAEPGIFLEPAEGFEPPTL
jgi:hypothetical protein